MEYMTYGVKSHKKFMRTLSVSEHPEGTITSTGLICGSHDCEHMNEKSEMEEGVIHSSVPFSYMLIQARPGPPANHYSVHAQLRNTLFGRIFSSYPQLQLHPHPHLLSSSQPQPGNRSLEQHPNQHQRDSNHSDDRHGRPSRPHNLFLMERLHSPLGVLSYHIITYVAEIPGDQEDQERPTKNRDEEQENESSAHLTLDLDVVLGDALGKMWSVREFPTGVHFAVGLFENAAITFKDGASFGFGTVGDRAVFVAEEGLEHLVVDGEGGTLLLEDVHVIVGHEHARSNLFVGAETRQRFVGSQIKAVAWWQATVALAGEKRAA